MKIWPARIALARLRPFDTRARIRFGFVVTVFALFLWGDFAIFRRVFRAAAEIEALSPFFAIGLVENFLALVLLVALMVLFFSALTSSIGAFFTDRDLAFYHGAPISRARILVSRWLKCYVQSSYLVISFLLPMFAAIFLQWSIPVIELLPSLVDLLLFVSIAISAASTLILLLVRFFPVARVQQIAATLGILVLTLVIVGVRMARPERLFSEIGTDELVTVLAAIDMPGADRYPGGWLATTLTDRALGETSLLPTTELVLLAFGAFLVFMLVGTPIYFRSWVRAQEISAPSALAAGLMTRLLDRLLRNSHPQTRALFSKEVRIVTRDATQWSQLFMMIALLFLYLYNIHIMPLEGDARAPLLAWLNLGMTGFVVSAICLRFAYPSLSAEGKQFWILQSSPIGPRRLIWVKYLVYLLPLLVASTLLTVMANAILEAGSEIWLYTVAGTVLITSALVALGVGMGSIWPDFERENPVEVALSLGGFAYMAVSLLYVGSMMFLFARPIQRYVLRILFGHHADWSLLARLGPAVAAVVLSILLVVLPLEIARSRLARRL